MASKKIHGIVNKNNNKSESIIYEINNYVEKTIMNEIIKSRSTLDMNPLVARFIYDYHFNGGDIKYEEWEYDGLIDIINKDMNEQFIIEYILKIMNIAETRDLKDLIKYNIVEKENDEDLFDEDDDYDEDYDDEEEL